MTPFRLRQSPAWQNILAKGILFSLLWLIGFPHHVSASSSFSRSASFLQSFEVNTLLKHCEPTRLRLTFGAAAQTEIMGGTTENTLFQAPATKDVLFFENMRTELPMSSVLQAFAENLHVNQHASMPANAETPDLTTSSARVNTRHIVQLVIMDAAVLKCGEPGQYGKHTSPSLTPQQAAVSELPEPASFLLMGAGLLGLACYRRKKKHDAIQLKKDDSGAAGVC